MNNELIGKELFASKDVITDILADVKDVETRNVLSQFLKERGIRGNKDVESLFVLWHMNGKAINRIESNLNDFITKMERQTESHQEKLSEIMGNSENELSSIIQEIYELKSQLVSTIEGVQEQVSENVAKNSILLVNHTDALSGYIVDLMTKINAKEHEMVDSILKSVMPAVQQMIDAKMHELDAAADVAAFESVNKVMPGALEPHLQKFDRLTQVGYNKIKFAVKTWETKRLVRDLVVYSASATIGGGILLMLAKMFH